MYQNEQPTGTEPQNNQFTDNNNNNNEYQNTYTGNDYTGNNYNSNNYTGNNNSNTYTGNNYNSNNYNGNYQQYPYSNYNGNYQVPYQQDSLLDLEEPMKIGEWLITFLIMMLPCVNIIMVFVWAFGSTEKKSKSNFFKAWLIFMGIFLALYLILIIAMAALGISYGLY